MCQKCGKNETKQKAEKNKDLQDMTHTRKKADPCDKCLFDL